MSALPASSICCSLSRSDFIPTDEENYLITASNTSWMSHIKSLFNFDPLTFKIGRIMVRAFCFEEGVGLIRPETATLASKASRLGIDFSNEFKLVHLIKRLTSDKSNIFLSVPLKICHLTQSAFQVITYKKSVVVELTKDTEPVACMTIARPLQPHIGCLSNITQAMSALRSHFFNGSYKLIDDALVAKVAKVFFEKIQFFETFLTSAHQVNVTDTSEQMQFVVSKNPATALDIYVLFLNRSWNGSYKIVMQGLKITDQLLPIGVSISDVSETDIEAKKEVALRQHPHISRVMTPLYLHWKADGQDNMIHSWACFGSLGDFLKKPAAKSLLILDTIALQMIESVDTFHTNNVVHKDLSAENFVFDVTDTHARLFINDVGSSATADNKEDLSLVATHGYNLAPELAQKCIEAKGNFWNEIFELPLTFQDWQLSERFQLGILIARTYLGKTPFELACSRDEIWDRHPGMKATFTNYIADANANLLEGYLDDTDRGTLIKLYDKAFARYFITLPGNSTIKISSLEGEALSDYLSTFVSIFDTENRPILAPFLNEDEAVVRTLYKKAFKQMTALFHHEYYGTLNYFIATNKTPIRDFMGAQPPKIQARIDAISPLFDLDKSKRPDLKVILAALQTAIHLNP